MLVNRFQAVLMNWYEPYSVFAQEHGTRKEHLHQLKKTGLLAILSCHVGYLFESVANIAEVENGEHKCWSETAD